MNNLKTVSGLVKQILEEDVLSRDSDNQLYLNVLEFYAKRKGISLLSLNVPLFLQEIENKTFPCFETVRRSRQKIQEIYPELGATKRIRSLRVKNEKYYREFAISKI